jgi:hypothetical protein
MPTRRGIGPTGKKKMRRIIALLRDRGPLVKPTFDQIPVNYHLEAGLLYRHIFDECST